MLREVRNERAGKNTRIYSSKREGEGLSGTNAHAEIANNNAEMSKHTETSKCPERASVWRRMNMQYQANVR